MNKTRIWNNKNYVEDWLQQLPITNYLVKTIGRGHRGVLLYIFDKIDIDKFIENYSGNKSKYAYFYLMKDSITKDNPIYVSISKIGYTYGGINTIK